MTYVWGVAFGKDIGAEKTPHSSSARCVSTFYAFFALIVANTYCANLMAFLVQETFELPISGIRDSKVTELNVVVVIWMILSQYSSLDKLCTTGLVSVCLYSPVLAKRQPILITLYIIKILNASIFPPAQYVNILLQMETTPVETCP